MKPGKVVTANQFAAITGYSQQTVQNWLRAGLPYIGKGANGKAYEIDTAAAIKWLIDRTTLAVDGQSLDFDRDRARKMAADADVAEMERNLLRSKLVEVDVAVGMVADRLQTVRQHLRDWPVKSATKLAACRTRDEVVEEMDSDVRDLLWKLSGADAAILEDEER